jgi:hypothetical protein
LRGDRFIDHQSVNLIFTRVSPSVKKIRT